MADGFWWRAQAACAAAPLEMVDAAFKHSRGKAGLEFRSRFCAFCPVWEPCLREAMETGEAGVWGGTSQDQRTHYGSPSYVFAKPDPNRVRREA